MNDKGVSEFVLMMIVLLIVAIVILVFYLVVYSPSFIWSILTNPSTLK